MFATSRGAGPHALIQMNGRTRSEDIDPTVFVMIGDGLGLAQPKTSNVTTERLIDYAIWIRHRVASSELTGDLEDACAHLSAFGITDYKLNDSHEMCLTVKDWPMMTILAQNAARNINGQRRFITEFTRLVKELGHEVSIRRFKTEISSLRMILL